MECPLPKLSQHSNHKDPGDGGIGVEERNSLPFIALVAGPLDGGGEATHTYGGHDSTLSSKLELPVATVHLKPGEATVTGEVKTELRGVIREVM